MEFGVEGLWFEFRVEGSEFRVQVRFRVQEVLGVKGVGFKV